MVEISLSSYVLSIYFYIPTLLTLIEFNSISATHKHHNFIYLPDNVISSFREGTNAQNFQRASNSMFPSLFLFPWVRSEFIICPNCLLCVERSLKSFLFSGFNVNRNNTATFFFTKQLYEIIFSNSFSYF